MIDLRTSVTRYHGLDSPLLLLLDSLKYYKSALPQLPWKPVPRKHISVALARLVGRRLADALKMKTGFGTKSFIEKLKLSLGRSVLSSRKPELCFGLRISLAVFLFRPGRNGL